MPSCCRLSARLLLYLLIGLLATHPARAQQSAQSMGLVPLPREVKTSVGTYALPQKISIYAPGKDAQNVAGLLKDMLAPLGKTVVLTTNRQAAQIKLLTATTPSPKATN